MRSFTHNSLDLPTHSISRPLSSEDLARLLGLAVATVRFYTGNAHHAHKLPCWFKLPGSNRLAWDADVVSAFIERGKAQYATPIPKRRPGRPTKAEQLQKQQFPSSKLQKIGFPELEG